jgi:hypothetical protein
LASIKDKMRMTFLFAALASALLSVPLAVADTNAELSQRLVGAWSERNHDVTYLQNGEWRLSKNGVPSPDVCRWQIKDGYLIQFRDGVTFPPEKMVWVTPNEFHLEDSRGGQSAPYYRHAETP